MKKKELIKKANEAHQIIANQLFNTNNLLYIIEHAEQNESGNYVFKTRSGKEYTLQYMLDELHKSHEKIVVAYNNCSELFKGVLHALPDNIDAEPMSLFE